jgi:hypothetical protein
MLTVASIEAITTPITRPTLGTKLGTLERTNERSSRMRCFFVRSNGSACSIYIPFVSVTMTMEVGELLRLLGADQYDIRADFTLECNTDSDFASKKGLLSPARFDS